MPTLIDESGFSKYDFLDLTGIVPELAGVAGAVKGAISCTILGLAMVGAINCWCSSWCRWWSSSRRIRRNNYRYTRSKF